MRRLAICALLVAIAQAAAQQPSFDVASIKLADLKTPSPPYRLGPNIVSLRSSLKQLVMLAYDVEDYQVSGGPEWISSERYDVEAKSAAAAPTAELKSMLKAILADRFQLKLNHETRTMSGYVLTVDKNGPKLPPARAGLPEDSLGVVQLGGGEIWARSVPIRQFAHALHLELEVPVLDQTGIAGHYDFKIRFEEANRDLMDSSDNGVGSIFGAVQGLGLKLEARKLPIDVLVIANAERPAAN